MEGRRTRWASSVGKDRLREMRSRTERVPCFLGQALDAFRVAAHAPARQEREGPKRPLAGIDDAEIAIAREIQAAFLPKTCQGCEGATIAARRLTSGSIGGDFHDFVVGPDGRYSLIIGDVVGHGVHSALAMALVLGAIRALGPRAESPLPLLQQINRFLCRINDDLETTVLMCSLFYGVVDRGTQILRYCNAGHPYPLMHTKNRTVLKLWPNCPLLGVGPDLDCHAIPLGLRFIERGLFYTDGITEARSCTGKFLGVGRTQQIFEDTLNLSVEEQADALMGAVRDHVGYDRVLADDASVFIVSFEPQGWGARTGQVTGTQQGAIQFTVKQRSGKRESVASGDGAQGRKHPDENRNHS